MRSRLVPRWLPRRLGEGGLLPSLPALGNWPGFLPWLNPPTGTAAGRSYAAHLEESGARFLMARGDHPSVTQALLDGVRCLTGTVGFVIVETTPTPREWLVTSIPRTRVLEGLLSVRDLLGRGHLDVAIFSRKLEVELFLDRLGTLEIRTGSWLEPRLRGVLESRGFNRVSRLSVLPPPPEAHAWDDEHRERLNALRFDLGCRPVPPRTRGASGIGG